MPGLFRIARRGCVLTWPSSFSQVPGAVPHGRGPGRARRDAGSTIALEFGCRWSTRHAGAEARVVPSVRTPGTGSSFETSSFACETLRRYSGKFRTYARPFDYQRSSDRLLRPRTARHVLCCLVWSCVCQRGNDGGSNRSRAAPRAPATAPCRRGTRHPVDGRRIERRDQRRGRLPRLPRASSRHSGERSGSAVHHPRRRRRDRAAAGFVRCRGRPTPVAARLCGPCR